ncbi:hypothetical protein HmCmsJML020_02368 [Escherichia coli]|nr:hypothetical protein HmCmsJML020_02368 [Escherichia coli]
MLLPMFLRGRGPGPKTMLAKTVLPASVFEFTSPAWS